MNHQFNVAVAVDVGLVPAVVFNAIGFWVAQNAANGRNYIDGHYWTYNTVKAWADLFPYCSSKQIEKALAKLREQGYIIAANYNKDKWDRTLWYTLTSKGEQVFSPAFSLQGKRISPTGEMDFPSEGNDYITSTVNNSVPNTDYSTPNSFESDLKAIIDYFNERCGTRYTYRNKAVNGMIHARLSEGFTVEDFKTVIDTKAAKWENDPKMRDYLRPKTLFSASNFESYLNEQAQPKSRLDEIDWSMYEIPDWTADK